MQAQSFICSAVGNVEKFQIHKSILARMCDNNLFDFFQITYIGGIIHATSSNNFQIMAGSASFLTPYMSLGKFL